MLHIFDAGASAPARLDAFDFDFDSAMRCPACPAEGEDAVHMHAVSVNRGGRIAAIDADGVRQTESGLREHRGALIEIAFSCERGHQFRLRFLFHKGLTIADVVHDEPWVDMPAELWRD